MEIIKTINLTKKFGDFTANSNISLSVKEKEIKCIVGENGAGKSTLMNMLYGVFKPTSGQIFIRGKEVHFSSPSDAMAHGIGMVHQHFKLVSSLTVYENILLGTEILYSTKKGIKTPFIDNKKEIQAVRDLIETYHFTLDPLDKIKDLSVGSRQRVEILKMLYRNVDILILDEPTAVLTPQEVDDLIESLKNLKANGKTILVITHKLREVLAVSDSVTVIKQGEVTGNVLTHLTSEKELANMMVGRDVVLSVKNTGSKVKSDETLLEVISLSTINTYGKECVKDVSFSVKKGEILGIAGVEGNGQTELVKILTGIMESTSGMVRLAGNLITNKYPDTLRSEGLGIIPEDRYAQGLCESMTIAQNCIAGYHSQEDICNKLGIFNQKAIEEKRDTLISSYDIRVGDVDGNVGQLSGGNAQKVIIARELHHKPDVLLACQPTRGVDVGSIEFIHEQLLTYRDEGHAVLLISSELTEIMSLSDRVLVMYKGSICGEINPKTASLEEVGLLMAGISQKGTTQL